MYNFGDMDFQNVKFKDLNGFNDIEYMRPFFNLIGLLGKNVSLGLNL